MPCRLRILGKSAVIGFCLAAAALDSSRATALGSKRLPPASQTKVDFRRDVAPILRSTCLECHDAKQRRGGLALDSRADAIKGGDSGAVIVPGNSAQSRLIQLVAGAAEDDTVMPPDGRPRLSSAEVGLLRGWIDQGAAWPAQVVLSAPEGRGKRMHWAFQPIAPSRPPEVRAAGWVRNPIDRYVLSRLEAEGIAPSPEADRRTLIRRLALDLVGIPPTPEEVSEFLADDRPGAYERLVDRLFANPRYGEKWTRSWLDVCHYADSDGYLQDMWRPVAWRFRDWVVAALNKNMPFDQFTIEQLAGDLLPGATIDQKIATGFLRNTLSNREGGADLEEYRVEQIVDRTQMMGTAWLGLTVGCARCHDHKYDPITQREFYQLYAFFNNTDERNIDAPLRGELEPYRAQKPEYDRRRSALVAPVRKELDELEARWEKKMLDALAHPGQDYLWDRQWEVLGLVWGQQLGEGQLEGCEIVLTERARRTRDQKDRLLDYFLKYGEIVDPRRFAELKLHQLSEQLERLRAELPKITRAPIIVETGTPRQTHIHLRGDFRNAGIAVEPATLALAPAPAPARAPNRLTLARWLVARENPLTARVAVNRFWQEFFGRGLVLTSENFGTQGDQPSHPRLLDWLAAEFRDHGWNVKSMHRLIVTSAVYRQSSRSRPELRGRDPNNRLLARQESLRFSSDQVRDAVLAASGLLDSRIGGPCVFPPQPDSVAKEAFDNKWIPSRGNDRHRRGLYTFIQRTSPFAQSVIFDAPPLSRSCTRRERSNTPLQALVLLNDPVFFEGARALAAEILRGAPPHFDARLTACYERCVNRPPTAAEQAALRRYLDLQASILRRSPQPERLPKDIQLKGVDAATAGAWTGLCSVVLNLHEFITRD